MTETICKTCEFANICRSGKESINGGKVKMLGCTRYEKRKEKTNADHIRAMTDEELARMLAIGCHETRECPTICEPIYPYDEVVESCEKCWLEWLKQEAER